MGINKNKPKTMKFAVAALLVSASAIRINKGKRGPGPCITPEDTNEVYADLDTNGNGSLNVEEVKDGLEQLAKSYNYTITADDWKWLEATGERIDKKNEGTISKHEFWRFSNAVARHFHICPEQCVTWKESNWAFNKLDHDKSKDLSYDEVKAGIEYAAKAHNHTLTADEWKWLEEAGSKIDTKNPGSVSRMEFYRFANVVGNHFDICPN